MNDGFFDTFGGDLAKLNDTDHLECKICWWEYDPTVGDEYWQIPPNTPFSQLPEQWSCPSCDGKREEFMVIDK